MKTKRLKTLKKLISFVCTIVLLFSTFAFFISANEDTSNDSIILQKNNDAFFQTTKPFYLTHTQNESDQYEHGTIIEQSYEIISAYSFDSYVITVNACNGITLVSPSTIIFNENDSKIFTVKFKITDGFFSDSINVSASAYMQSNNTPIFNASSTIYCLKSGGYNYISLNTLDSLAIYSDELSDMIDSLNRSGEHTEIISAGNPNARSSSGITVNGTILWKDSVGNTHPARNLTVEICDEFETTPRAIVTTNSNGYYSCNFPVLSGENNIYIVIKVSGLNITIKDNSEYPETYSYKSDTTYDLYDDSIVDKSYTFCNQTELGMTVSIHQAMEMANRYVYELEGEYIYESYVYFNGGSTAQGNYEFNVLSQDAFDWDVLQHEYGHLYAEIYDIDVAIGGTHRIDQNLIGSYNDSYNEYYTKEEGIELAWSEGLATYFAIKAQEEMNAASLNIPNVGDRYYSDTGDQEITFDLETTAYLYLGDEGYVEGLDVLLGEGSEAVVAAILYDLTDPRNEADFDQVYCYSQDIWNIMTSNQCTTLSTFIQGIYNAYSTSFAFKLGILLEYFRVCAGPGNPIMLSSNTPYFTWIKGGVGTNMTTAHTLVFYNTSYQKIKEITVTDNSKAYLQLTKAQWDEIKALAGGSTFYYSVRSSLGMSPTTGPYLSSAMEITIP